MCTFLLPSNFSSFQLLHLAGFGDFWQTLEFNLIYTELTLYDSLYYLNAAVESLPGNIRHCIKNPTVEFILLAGIHLSKYALGKISRLCDFVPVRNLVLPCVVALGFCYLLKRQNYWKFGKERRKIALLSKASEQSHANNNLKDIERHILSRLKQELYNESIQLNEKSWDQDLDDGQQPVIVFCVISSRIGTDIENAMRGVHGKSRVVLVLIHCVLSSLLRGDLSDDEELLDPAMKNRMEGIIHFAFSDREGLYDCQQNRLGFNKLRYTISFLPK